MEKKDYISLLHKNNIYPSGSQTARSFSRSGKHQKRENHGKKANSKFSLARRGFHLCPISQIKDPILPKKIVTSRMRSRRNEYWTSPLRTKSDREATQSLIDRKVTPIEELCKQAEAEAPKRRLHRQQALHGAHDDDAENEDYGKLDIMALLDHKILGNIKREFVERREGLSLEDFIQVMTKYLPIGDIGELALASNLCQFFSDVDVNGDGSMDWNEFSNFIIDRGMNQMDMSRTDSVVEYRNSRIQDTTVYNGAIDKILYLPVLDHLLVLESSSSSFWVIDAKDLSAITRVGEYPENRHGHRSEITNAEYISKFGWVATASYDRTIRFWDPHSSAISIDSSSSLDSSTSDSFPHTNPHASSYTPLKHVINTETTHMVMRWSAERNLMYTATDNQKIEVWRFGDRVNTHKDNFECDVVQSYNAHQNVILDLLILENMGTLASASMDETIALWDINTHQLHHELKGHDHGVFGLAYHSEYHALISAAYEHSAIVWNPYCAKIICKLKHGSPLIGVQAVPDSPQILTADKAGVVKVWDIRNFGCVQAFHVEDSKDTRVSEITSFAQIHPHKQLVAGGERLYMQESLTSSSHHSPDVADLEPTIRAIYNSNTSTFITASGQTIKIWKGVNGILQRVYRNITQHEISALCLDHTEKKFIVGDVSGAIHVHNYLNGALMMSVKESDREITSLFYVPELKQILSASWDNCICLLDENQEDGLPLMKRLRHHKDEITCAAISSNLSLYASASCDGFIYLWDFRSHVLGGELLGHKSEVTALAFLDPYPLLVSADSEGNLCFWIVRPLLVNVSKCILRLVNRSKQKSRSSTKVDSSACSVTAIVFLETGTESNLYTGDANGHIKVWEISSAIQRWGIKPFHTDDSLSNINKDSSSSSSVHPAYSSHMEDPSDTSMADLSSIIDSGKLDDDDTGVSFVQDGKKADIHGDVLNHGSQKRDSGGSGVNDTSIRKRNKLQPIRSRFADYVRYRNEPCHRNLAYTLTMNAQKNVNRNTLLKPGDIKLKRWWSAHGDSIRDLRFILDPQPRGLISCAFDKKVCLWDFQGASLGHLQQGRQGGTKQRNLDPPYRFHSDLSGRRQRQQNHALKVLAHLQAKREQEKKTEHIAEMLAKERERIRVSKGSAKRDGHRRKSNRGGQRSVGPISGSSSPHQPVMSHDR